MLFALITVGSLFASIMVPMLATGKIIGDSWRNQHFEVLDTVVAILRTVVGVCLIPVPILVVYTIVNATINPSNWLDITWNHQFSDFFIVLFFGSVAGTVAGLTIDD